MAGGSQLWSMLGITEGGTYVLLLLYAVSLGSYVYVCLLLPLTRGVVIPMFSLKGGQK